MSKRKSTQPSIVSSIIRLALPAVLWVGYQLFVRSKVRYAGAQPEEMQRNFTGDELIPTTSFVTTRGIDINATPEQVWPWIAQIGRDGTGFYGLDSLINKGTPSVAYIRHDLPAPQSGDKLDDGSRILDVQPNQYVLFGTFNQTNAFDQPVERTTLLQLDRQITGLTRLIVRTRGRASGMLGPLYSSYYEVADYFLSNAQLHNIKARAETTAKLVLPAQV